MQKSQRATPQPPAGTVVQPMPRAPAVVPASPSLRPSTSTPRPGPAVHPMAAHHDRVSTLHEHFLRLQDGIHGDYLSHRQRLLDGLTRALGLVAPRPGADASAALDPSDERVERAIDDEPSPVTFTTEVGWNDRFLDAHVMPAGVLLEPLGRIAGLRPSLAGTGFGILACDLEYLGALPEPGETVLTEIHAGPGSVQAGERQLPFHVACRTTGLHVPRFSGASQMGERARPLVSVACRYSPWEQTAAVQPGRGQDVEPSISPGGRMTADGAPDSAPSAWAWTRKGRFSERELDALVGGDAFTCFGTGFERAASHTRTPPLPGARLIRLTGIDALEPTGGPWSMGSLRAQAAAEAENGPPVDQEEEGLRLARLYQGALQTLAFFVAAAGGTIERDGWRFEPVVGHMSHLRFTDAPGWDSPLQYELVVERFDGAPFAAIVGDVKAWAGGKLVFHGQRLSLRLVPDWPLTSDRDLLEEAAADDANARPTMEIDGFRIGYRSLLAGALGRPSDAFREPGTFFETGDRQMPRLPGPPYHFITRVTAAEGERLTMRPGAEATMEYDVPPDAWYFDDNGNRTMPFCVLLEAALQPCGWLSVYVGCPLTTSEDVFFRNLDGAAMTMTAEVLPDSGTLRTHAKVTSVTRVSGVMLLSYKIECFLGDRPVCRLNATFGYFPKKALAQQAGLPTSDEQRAQLAAESHLQVEFAERQARYFGGALRLPGPMLIMIDRVTGYFPNAGAAGKGRLRAEKDVEPNDWFFKAHFYSDPVQPGSLGLEMMLQLLQFFVIHEDLGSAIERPYFEPLALDSPISWKFRGQVRPENKRIVTDVEIVSVESRPDDVTVIATGSLWVDGVRCYEAKGIGVRVRGGRQVPAPPPRVEESTLDPAVDRWVADHRPSYTVPVMPGMSMVDRLAGAALAHVRAAYPPVDGAPDWVIVGADDVRHHGWLVCDVPKRLRTEVTLLNARAANRIEEVEAAATLYEMTDSKSAPRRVSTGRVRLARHFATPPRAWARLADAVPVPSPYETGSICWGPRLQLLRRLALGPHGASAELDAAGADAPIGAVHHILLDGTLHGIPHDELERWSPKVPPGHMGVPVRLAARFFGPTPREGIMRAEIRFAGFDGASAFPAFLIQIIDPQGRVWASLRHVEVLVPMSHRRLLKEHRVPFLVQRRFHEGVGLSEFYPDRSELHAADVKRLDGLPGSVAHVYGLERGAVVDHRIIAIKDHVGQRARVHPDRILVDASLSEGRCEELPFVRFPVSLEQRDSDVVVRDVGPPTFDLGPLRAAWRRCGLQDVEAALEGLLARVRLVSVAEPSALSAASVIFLSAAHDPDAELTLLLIVAALREHPVRGLVALPLAGEWADVAARNGLTQSFAGQPVSAALDQARSLLEQHTSVVVSTGDTSPWRMSDVAGPLASLAVDCGAVVVPVDIRHADDGVECRIGQPILPDDLRTRDRI